jgi:hypothetical protein
VDEEQDECVKTKTLNPKKMKSREQLRFTMASSASQSKKNQKNAFRIYLSHEDSQ